ncbi:hypothetical protein [Rhizobium sp. AG207R]|uniref:hypothetical protein n=1 Tax=Rhizobium sp. AG207R TaxID=2802287 RepID=UPI0022AC3B15|nr:hypothetical protein [Rhizobium sp. AG207R]MCZ3377417.1 hypothetical protein [Rhizobium sp. AG207R]
MRLPIYLLFLFVVSNATAATLQTPEDAVLGYNACIMRQIDRFKISCDRPDFVALAIEESCNQEINIYKSAVVRSFGKYEDLVTTLQQARRETAIAAIVEWRLTHTCGGQEK